MISTVPSCELSSTITISTVSPAAFVAREILSTSGRMFGDSLYVGTMIETDESVIPAIIIETILATALHFFDVGMILISGAMAKRSAAMPAPYGAGLGHATQSISNHTSTVSSA